jgi:hypothetical protein
VVDLQKSCACFLPMHFVASKEDSKAKAFADLVFLFLAICMT